MVSLRRWKPVCVMLRLVWTPLKREEPPEWVEATLAVGFLLVELIKPSFVICWMFFYEAYTLLVVLPIGPLLLSFFMSMHALFVKEGRGVEK